MKGFTTNSAKLQPENPAITQPHLAPIHRHGAGAINALFMRENSTFIEIRPFEFGTKYK